MSRIVVTVLALFAFLQCAQSVAYRATVVEYRSTPDEANTVLKNVDNYVQQIELYGRETDIIVFPEYGLTTLDVFKNTNWRKDYTLYAPKSYESIILCDETNHVEKALKDISCVAKRKEVYVVINFIEKDNSTSNELFYNTNLVFDTTGKIAAKYRKINLYAEDDLTPGKDIVTFETKFGVKFGIFTCYDILFKNPASDILTDGINDIIYPTAWISQTPFAVSLSVQAGYAKKNKVNLLAADYNNPSASNGGSGIYSGTGVMGTSYISGQHATRVITLGKVDSVNRSKTCDFKRGVQQDNSVGEDRAVGMVPTLQDFKTQPTSSDGYTFVYKSLSVDDVNIKDEVCLNSFCCKFEAIAENKLSTETGTYKWAIQRKEGATSCALVFCKTSDDNSCGERIDQNTKATFSRIFVSGNFPKNQYTIPITSKVDLRPIYAYSYCAKDTDSNNEDIIMEIYDDFHKNVTAFGIVGYLKAGAGAVWGNTVLVTLLGLYAIIRHYV